MITFRHTAFALLLFFWFQPAGKTQDCIHEKELYQKESARYQKMIRQSGGIFQYGYNVIFQRIEHRIDPAQLYIDGSVTTWFIAEASLGTQLRFDLAQSFTIHQILYHGNNLTYTHSDKILTISLPQVIPAGTTDSVTIVYEGPPGSNTGLEQGYHGILSPNTPMVFTNSEPYFSRDWFPCKQSLDDKIDSIDIILINPAQYQTASNGLIVSETVSGGFRRTHWKHRYPIAHYLVAYAITEFSLFKQFVTMPNGDTLEIHNYLWPEDIANNNYPGNILIDIMEFYNDLFLPYPYSREKYGQATWTHGGAMENQTITFTQNYNVNLMAHELAHHWFGNYITCGSWPEIWLNESFATFAAAIVYEQFYEQAVWMNWKSSTIDYVTSDPSGSVFVNDTSSFATVFNYRLVYQKGAIMLNMLRWELGDQAFYQGIRNYLNDPDLAHGFASADDIISHWEETADTILTGFFEDWLFGEGYPVYEILFTQDADHTLHGVLSQETTHPSVDFFEMRVPVLFVGENNDTVLIIHHLTNHQSFTFQPGFEVTQTTLDPQRWLLTRDASVNKIELPANSENRIKVSPNPAKNKVTIHYPFYQHEVRITLLDQGGKTVMITQPEPQNRGVMEIDLGNFSSGIYMVRIDMAKEQLFRKIIKL
jgi:aminopeptidase N